jgi:hypothetical protein
MSRDGKKGARRPKIEVRAPGASPEEEAAIAAALELHFAAATRSPSGESQSRWQRIALREGVSRSEFGAHPWTRA